METVSCCLARSHIAIFYTRLIWTPVLGRIKVEDQNWRKNTERQGVSKFVLTSNADWELSSEAINLKLTPVTAQRTQTRGFLPQSGLPPPCNFRHLSRKVLVAWFPIDHYFQSSQIVESDEGGRGWTPPRLHSSSSVKHDKLLKQIADDLKNKMRRLLSNTIRLSKSLRIR